KLRLFTEKIFFFQAEDGIRDGHVTGVQTCALPIYIRMDRPTSSLTITNQAPIRSTSAAELSLLWERAGGSSCKLPTRSIQRRPRSEERRVGKECRYRWWT